jgi:hypothetical protein
MPGRTTVYATWNGKTKKRTAARAYTHASVVRWSDGSEAIVSFHTSEALALRGTLHASQVENGARVVAAVPVTTEPPQ